MERSVATVALVGRSNVGKSTLFNRLVGNHTALVDNVAGTTRDRQSGVVFWRGRRFTAIDCGGLDLPGATELERGTTAQARLAMAKAQIILLMVDVPNGILPGDRKLAKELRPLADRVIVVANKADQPPRRAEAAQFAQLGLGQAWAVSAINGSGVGDLLDEVLERITARKLAQPAELPAERIKVAFLGRTNVGKSSLANALLGEQRLVVSAQPHTTRTAISLNLIDHGQLFELTDTAGLNRKPTRDRIDEKATTQTMAALNSCDVALLVTDAADPLTHQDRHLAGLAADVRCGLIIVANKWDLLPDKTTSSPQEWERHYRASFPFLAWAPIAFSSATTRAGVAALLNLIREINVERSRVISDNALSRFLKGAMTKHRPLAASGKGKPFLSDFKQVGTKPPRFELQVRAAHPLSPAYVRYLQNTLRQKFGFMGTPIHIDLQQLTMGGGRVKPRYRQPVRRGRIKK